MAVIPPFGVIVAHEKSHRRYFDATAAYQFSASVKELVRERIDRGWYNDDDATRRQAADVLASNDAYRCWQFLQSRREYEYERVECVALERYGGSD